MKSHEGVKEYSCELCHKKFATKQNLDHHMIVTLHEKRKAEDQVAGPSKRAKRNNKKVLGVFHTEDFFPSEEVAYDLIKFFEEVEPQLQKKLEEEVEENAIRWYSVLDVKMSRTGRDGKEESVTAFFSSKCLTDLLPHTIPEHIEEAHEKITKSFEEFTQRGSGWVLDSIVQMKLNIGKYQPLAASSYIPTPKHLEAKKAVLNIQNTEDNKCFLWCVLAHKYPVPWGEHGHRVEKYEAYKDSINMSGIEYPVPINKIPRIEKLNNLRINVFGYEEKEVFPLHISTQENEDCINLLYITNETNRHYTLITSMSRLLGDLTHHNGEAFYCERCLHRFSEERLLQQHTPYCNQHSPQHIKMPVQGEHILKFENIHYQHKVPYIIYADFESLIEKVDEVHAGKDTSNTVNIAHHKACGYAYIIIGLDGKSYKPITVYRGPDAVDHFLNNLIAEKEELANILTHITPIVMTPQDELDFRSATHCSLCNKLLNGDRVRDHCHISGNYRGALHNACNLKYRLQKKIPVVIHNLKNYDSHLIMQGLGKIKDHEINIIPTTMEKYISFSLAKKYNNIRVSLNFIDSFQFMSTSLQKLVSNLTEDQFKILKENIPQHTNLLLKKGVYPYEYMDDFEKFHETQLPPIEAFSSTLTGNTISSEDYTHAQTVWNTFHITNLGEYHDLYVKSDVLQLADVFENFRKLCREFYNIDCAHLMTAPGLAWEGCLKMTDQPLELLTDPDMHLFVEQGIRGGISMISKRWAKANNKYLEDYNPEDPSKYIMYLDANNLYGWAMSQPLPVGNFEWLDVEDITHNWILSIPEDSEIGYIMEVDLHYPPEVHDLHNDYPLAPEKMNITFNDLSPFSKNLLPGGKYHPSTKLVPNLNTKLNYITYYKNLQFYLKHGLQLIKVHKVLQFRQKAWLKPYIDFNTEQRKNAKSAFEKDFFKLMNNAVYGKTMENIRKRRDIELVHQERRAKKLIADPSFKRFKIFDHDLVGVERVKKTLTLNKPLYVGFVILELSKILMYDFHYNIIKRDYGEKARLLFTDTDSLTYEIETEDIYEDMKKHINIYDTSDYPQDHPLYSTSNKKRIGCFKDELNSIPIQEFVGLRPKMYSILSKVGEKKTAKGVSRSVVEKRITHQHYKSCLENLQPTRETLHRIQSEGHRLHTVKQKKIALCAFDDKRHIQENGIDTLAHGHYHIS